VRFPKPAITICFIVCVCVCASSLNSKLSWWRRSAIRLFALWCPVSFVPYHRGGGFRQNQKQEMSNGAVVYGPVAMQARDPWPWRASFYVTKPVGMGSGDLLSRRASPRRPGFNNNAILIEVEHIKRHGPQFLCDHFTDAKSPTRRNVRSWIGALPRECAGLMGGGGEGV